MAMRRFIDNRKGVGAVEFALVAPVLIVLYVGSLEVSVAMSVNKKVARATSAVADLITQESSVNKNYLKTMVDVAQSIISPFDASSLTMKVSGINIDSDKKATISWSWNEKNGRPYTVGSAVTLPSELLIADTFLVRSEIGYDHSLLLVLPGAEDVSVNKLNMAKTYYLRQRVGSGISCTNC